ncbi:MAG: sigma-70 family RNA polymerase sigma factor [Treponema sp.]|nr:sigma-70 family RNA polymerase sigma factor [Treponema sp.]
MPDKNAAETFKQYSARLLRFIRGKVHLLEDAEDILQDVFYQFSRVDSMSNPIENTAAWLFRAARNRIIDKYRQKKEVSLPGSYDDEDDYLIDEIADIFNGEDSGPEDNYLRSLILQEIDTAIAGLSDEQREVFELSEFYAMPVKEIAKKIGVPENTVLSRKHYAVTHLRKHLQELYDDVMGTRINS